MYNRLLIATFTILGLTVLLSILPIHGEAELYDNVLRLHVIANSDSEEDQSLKLVVRDAILEESKKILKNCSSREEAKNTITQSMSILETTAQNAVLKEGYDYPVDLEIGDEEYPTKNYESCCFPAGEYLSLRVKIGEAQGQNWWCVLFPPMCLSAAGDSAEAYAQVGLTDSQYNIITQTDTPKYKARFKILEAFENAIS